MTKAHTERVHISMSPELRRALMVAASKATAERGVYVSLAALVREACGAYLLAKPMREAPR